MTKNIIEVKNLSKQYRLGAIGSRTIKHDFNRWFAAVRGKEDPYLKIGSVNDRTKTSGSDYVWSLKDINFEVKPGEALGIIGKNGAGKSTLLKILSRVTSPTIGTVRAKGRIASLLEVGTGFHPELTGRENIFLNGAIMGMSRMEIQKKFDEIVDFSGVEKYIDTPVKRYSSGMYVRLAFAVAAHLEPEILIVDEVLAVGDAEFQKKCLGKMQDVSENGGRTVLFVSHNMQAVQNLCTRAILLKHGSVLHEGSTESVITSYLSTESLNKMHQFWDDENTAPGNEFAKVKSIQLVPETRQNFKSIDVRTPLKVKFEFWNYVPNARLSLSMHLFSLTGDCVFDVTSPLEEFGVGLVQGECEIPGNFLNDGVYTVDMLIVKNTFSTVFKLKEGITFEVADFRENTAYYGKWIGAVRPKLPFTINAKAELVPIHK